MKNTINYCICFKYCNWQTCSLLTVIPKFHDSGAVGLLSIKKLYASRTLKERRNYTCTNLIILRRWAVCLVSLVWHNFTLKASGLFWIFISWWYVCISKCRRFWVDSSTAHCFRLLTKFFLEIFISLFTTFA